jgi:hypothetical protein
MSAADHSPRTWVIAGRRVIVPTTNDTMTPVRRASKPEQKLSDPFEKDIFMVFLRLAQANRIGLEFAIEVIPFIVRSLDLEQQLGHGRAVKSDGVREGFPRVGVKGSALQIVIPTAGGDQFEPNLAERLAETEKRALLLPGSASDHRNYPKSRGNEIENVAGFLEQASPQDDPLGLEIRQSAVHKLTRP